MKQAISFHKTEGAYGERSHGDIRARLAHVPGPNALKRAEARNRGERRRSGDAAAMIDRRCTAELAPMPPGSGNLDPVKGRMPGRGA
jgi:hypothetical protein